MTAYNQTAVMVFFVLSGYIIAYVLNEREGTLREYATARLARLHSIVIPALILTAVCDGIGRTVDPALYSAMDVAEDGQSVRYLATALFVNRFWDVALEPGSNLPFWSLSFEAVYYIAAGLIAFTRGLRRVLLIGLLFACAGPTIVFLAPVWFIGYGVYYLTKKLRFTPFTGWGLTVGGLFLLVLSPEIRAPLAPDGLVDRDFIGDYYDAIAFAIHVIGLHAISNQLTVPLSRHERLIRWLGSLTFALYLFHLPLIALFATVNIGAPESWEQRLYLYGGTFLIVATLGWWCERQKSTIKRALNAVRWRRAAVVPPT